MHTLGWYGGYLGALAKPDSGPLTPEDRFVLDELAALLRRMDRARARG